MLVQRPGLGRNELQLSVRSHGFQPLEPQKEAGRIHMGSMPNHKPFQETGAYAQIHASVHDGALKTAMQRQEFLSPGDELGGW